MTVSFRIQNKTIILSELPEFTPTTAGVLKKTKAVAQESILNNYNYDLTSTLKGRSESVETVRAALDTIQTHKTREIVCACLKTALVCAILAGTVLGGIFGGESAIVIIMLGSIFYCLFSAFFIGQPLVSTMMQFNRADHWHTKYERFMTSGDGVGYGFIAPFLPLYEVLTRQARIQRVRDKQDAEINSDLSAFLDLSKKLADNLPEIRTQLQGMHSTLSTQKAQYATQLQFHSQNALQTVLNDAAEAAILKLEKEMQDIQTTQEALTVFENFYNNQ